MTRAVGVALTDRLAVGVVEDNRLAGPVRRFPEEGDGFDTFQGMPAEEIVAHIRIQVEQVLETTACDVIGLGAPGVIRGGVIEDSPNLQQMKGMNIQHSLGEGLRRKLPVVVSNDADVVAAGIAATRGQLDSLTRVWTLGNGIGFGRYPQGEGIWEGGHSVVSLDPKETYCGCGGVGHLEGIMGHRAMRLRFLDMEPDEVFAAAKEGVQRCAEFVKLWHRALAAGTATNIHMDGPGRFFITGPNAKYLDVNLLHVFMQEMVKMSPLQGYVFEVVPGGEEIAIIGAAVNALRAASGG
jgi:glucokinase